MSNQMSPEEMQKTIEQMLGIQLELQQTQLKIQENQVKIQQDEDRIVQRELRRWLLEKELVLHLQHLSSSIATRGEELANLLLEHYHTYDVLSAILEENERDITETYGEIYENTLSNWGDRNDQIEAFFNSLWRELHPEKKE